MPRYIDADELVNEIEEEIEAGNEKIYEEDKLINKGLKIALKDIKKQPTADVEEVKRGHWIKCDYKKLEHGFIEIYPNEGYCCSVCRAAFEKRKMTYKQFCAACGAVMDERSDEA